MPRATRTAASHLPRAFSALLGRSVATMIQYRGEIFLWAAWGIIYPAVAMTMWGAAADAGGSAADAGGSTSGIGGYTRGSFAAYFLLTMVVGHVSAAWDAFEMGWLVRSGSMSPKLMQPLLPMWSSLADNIAYKVATLSMLIPIWAVVAWIAQPAFDTTWSGAAIGVIAMLLGAAINYIWGYNVACLAFWSTRVDAFVELWFGGSLVFGGRMAPVGLLPGPLQWISAALPFRWVFWFPASVLMGRIAPADALAGLAAQAAWIIGGIIAFRVLWREALKRYTAVGA